MGQSPNESNGFETNGNKYKCVWACKFVKMLKRRAASGGENPKNPWPTNT